MLHCPVWQTIHEQIYNSICCEVKSSFLNHNVILFFLVCTRAAFVPGCCLEAAGARQACGCAGARRPGVCGWAVSAGRGREPGAAGRGVLSFAASPCRCRGPGVTTLHKFKKRTKHTSWNWKHGVDRRRIRSCRRGETLLFFYWIHHMNSSFMQQGKLTD